ncbi:MAG: hypothetical protein RL368_2056, partial [Pseudomonadota bacterium]
MHTGVDTVLSMFKGVGLMSSLNQIITELKAGELIP